MAATVAVKRGSEWHIVRMVNVCLNINTFGRTKCIALKLKHAAERPTRRMPEQNETSE